MRGETAKQAPHGPVLQFFLDKCGKGVYIVCVSTYSTVNAFGGEYVFSINYRDARPIYEQVKDSLRVAILTGSMKKDEKCPSVRELAAELAINPNTIQKAYRELESEGYIYSVPGKGSFVAECREAVNLRKTELYTRLDGNITELMRVGETADSICAHIKNSQNREVRA